MKTKLYWEKKLFSNLYRIYSNGELIGILQNSTFSRTTDGELDGQKYSFRTKGIFKQHTEIIDCKNYKVIGKITYNGCLTKATILINENVINLEYVNFWSKKWCVFNSEGIKVQYSGSHRSGQIDSNNDDPLLLLIGLYVPVYFINWIRRS
jgi:hypothetical protein